MSSILRENPLTFDQWRDSLLPQDSEDRVALARAAHQLVNSPTVQRVLSVMEGEALEAILLHGLNDPELLPGRVALARAAFSVRANLMKLAEDFEFDTLKTTRHE